MQCCIDITKICFLIKRPERWICLSLATHLTIFPKQFSSGQNDDIGLYPCSLTFEIKHEPPNTCGVSLCHFSIQDYLGIINKLII